MNPNTLRAHFEQLRTAGATCSLDETISIVVPLAVELAQRHAAGETLYVNPSAVSRGAGGLFVVDPELSQRAPSLPRDRACLAPEERAGRPGNARASVYAVGAILYEALTGASVGPGMRRPTELNPAIPQVIEMLLAKALVADPAHRPDDLLALAQALHHLAPHASMVPPAADESHLDGGADFIVDVSMSMMPPKQQQAVSPYDVRVVEDETCAGDLSGRSRGRARGIEGEARIRPEATLRRRQRRHGPRSLQRGGTAPADRNPWIHRVRHVAGFVEQRRATHQGLGPICSFRRASEVAP
ncbi:MAG: hypothetical protein QM784_14490 [Polyangiaceae bacterium]